MAARLASLGRHGSGASAGSREPRRRDGALGGIIFALTACLFCFATIFWVARAVPEQPVKAPPAPPDPWVKINDPIPIYDLPLRAFDAQAPRYEAWRARAGKGRRDVLTLGSFADDAAFFQIAITRPRPGTEPQPFFAALARRAAYSGLALLKSDVPDGVQTRFGMLAASNVVLSGQGETRSCLGFRIPGSVVRMTGLACGQAGREMTPADLACGLDRLDLVSGAPDSPTTLFFERSELVRGQACEADELAPVHRKESWLEPSAPNPAAKAEAVAQRAPERARRKAKL